MGRAWYLTGGGAFINDRTRKHIKKGGLSVWLKADLDVLWERVSKRDTRPLLKTENPRQTLEGLMNARYPIYARSRHHRACRAMSARKSWLTKC